MFISIDGIDGCGKSTVARLLAERLPNGFLTKPLGADATSLKLRDLLLNPEHNLAPDAAPFLFIGDMLHVTHQVILPAIAAGKAVVSDRFLASTWVYQIEAPDTLTDVQKHQLESVLLRWIPLPDLTVVLDVTVPEAMRRIVARNPEFTEKDVYERCDAYMWERRRIAYLQYADSCVAEKDKVLTLYTDHVPQDRIESLVDAIMKHINQI